MSYTSLWEIGKNWNGSEYAEYKNAWLFPPVVWDILLCKYIKPSERNNNTSFLIWMGMFQSQEKMDLLNDRINNSKIQYDRVLWELTNASVFNSKDKEFVYDCIMEFVENNFKYYHDGDCEHIKERFVEVANDIKTLPKRCKYFVIHPTSVDDNVERWFYRKRLSSWDKFVCEFTIIENNKVVGFSDNLKMCKLDEA